MSLFLIVLDLLVYNFTPFSFNLVVLSIPRLKSFSVILVYFLILSFFDFRYLFNLLVLYVLFKINRRVDRKWSSTATLYIIKLVLTYAVYLALSFGFLYVLKKIGIG